ncbi:EEF1A lysine methyltransferase 2-like [Triticum dicoccoides]|uniref:EEF1A lysine methyltransferase 2-like n=1 Tax=Triticum dicoccoides TaxID=85692 RepID=UPI000E7BFB14|nr:EEF1A lysine methyltransferase 2-like [Triticum dicoccoides]
MAGIRWPPEDPEMFPTRMLGTGVWGGPPATAAGGGGGPPGPPGEMASDDDRSVAADSWSIKSDYGSTLDDEQRYADTAEVLLASSSSAASAAAPSACSSSLSAHHSSDFSFDKDVPDVVPPMLGLHNYQDGAYAEDLANYHERSHADDWFGTEAMDVLVGWTKNLCFSKDLPGCSVLDIGTGSGRLLQQLAKQGFSDLTGIDYSEAAIELARNLAIRDGFEHINFLVDDVLESKLERRFELVMDEGTLDAIGLHPDGPVKRMMYWQSVASLVSPGGILVITSCSRTKDELVQEVENFNQRKLGAMVSEGALASDAVVFKYLDHVQAYPNVDGICIATVAFLHT